MPKTLPMVVSGTTKAAKPMTNNATTSRYFPGLLFSNGFRLLTASIANIGIAISYAFMGFGFITLLSGEIIGGGCVGPLGGELIHEITAAMAGRMTARQLASMPHYHPTLAEIWTHPAEQLAGR